jgi:hypothetical protein
MEVLRLDDIGPDGVRMIVDWDRMGTSDSVFVPCLNVTKALKQIQAIFDRRGWKLRVHVSVENHIMGLRIWRIT